MLDTLLAFLLPIPEYATSLDYSAYTRVSAHAPIRMDACEASLAKTRGIVAHSTLSYGAAFTMIGEKPARRVRLRFDFVDRTWHPMGTSEVQEDGTFSPGIKISHTHQYGGDYHEKNRVYKGAVAVVCVPVEIDFADGSVWEDRSTATDPAPVFASPAPAATPSHYAPIPETE